MFAKQAILCCDVICREASASSLWAAISDLYLCPFFPAFYFYIFIVELFYLLCSHSISLIFNFYSWLFLLACLPPLTKCLCIYSANEPNQCWTEAESPESHDENDDFWFQQNSLLHRSMVSSNCGIFADSVADCWCLCCNIWYSCSVKESYFSQWHESCGQINNLLMNLTKQNILFNWWK